jgi:ketosteroid isomerase-like protein
VPNVIPTLVGITPFLASFVAHLQPLIASSIFDVRRRPHRCASLRDDVRHQECVMRSTHVLLSVVLGLISAAAANGADTVALAEQVRNAERAFAATMAARDQAAFAQHIAEDAVFFDGEKATRGRAAVVAAWKEFFAGPAAPFSWAPETVEVLDSGTLAHSSGPVFDPQGHRVATFNSIWRLEPDGKWRVVFDKGCSGCRCGEGERAR